MCHTGEQPEQLQERQQRQPIQMEPQQAQQTQQIQQTQQEQQAQANRLHDLPQQEQSATLEEAHAQQQRNANAALLQRALQIPIPWPHQQAPATPVQEHQPATSTYKRRYEEHKKRKKARAGSPVGTLLTYDIIEQLNDHKKQLDQSIQPFMPFITQVHGDLRGMYAFCHGYQVNRQGEPATPEDRAWKNADERFILDYNTRNLETRRPHLERIVDELLNLDLSPQTLSAANMQRNMGKIQAMADRMLYIDNIMRDPVNAPFFQEMDPVRKQMLQQSFPVFQAFMTALMMNCQQYGVDFNHATYLGMDKLEVIQMGIDGVVPANALYQAELPAFQQNRTRHQVWTKNRAALAGIYALPEATWRDASTLAVDHRRDTQATWETLKQDPQLSLTEAEQESALLTKSVALLQAGDEHQEANRQTLALMRDLSRNQEAVPAQELYDRTRAFAAPRVQQILDCDIEAWKQLSSAELVQRAEQLQTMADNAVLLPDVLETKHPTQTGHLLRPLALHQELVGQRLHEFDYKCATIRALAEQSRAFALLARSRMDGEIPATCLTGEENARPAGVLVEQLLQDKLDASNTQIQQATQRYHDIRTPGTPACQEWMLDFISKHNPTQYFVVSDKFRDVTERLTQSADPEIVQLRQRLCNQHYSSLAYTPSQLQRLGGAYVNNDIREPIFRTFKSFVGMEATQTVLSSEQFEQMMRNLGAGAGLSRTDNEPPSEEARQAIQQNEQGIAVYREVVRAQLDMIARKYGDKLEQITPTEWIDHLADMGRDFVDQQVILSMTERYPGFLNMMDEDDRLLYARIEYFNTLGGMAASFHMQIQAGEIQNATDMQAILQNLVNSLPACANARSYLEVYDPTFHHQQIDWSQRVQPPKAPQPSQAD